MKEVLLTEINRRKEKAIKELETIQEAKRNVKIDDKRKYIALKSKIKKLQYELDNMGKNKDRIIAIQRQQLKQLKADEEIKSQTTFELSKKDVLINKANQLINELPDNKVDFTELQLKEAPKIVEGYDFNKVGEGVEISHYCFEKQQPKPTINPLIIENGEIYRDE